jgi:choline-glycine betaine transporter
MSNPYTSPAETSRAVRPQEVNAPAIALIAISLIAIVFGVLGLGIDVFLLMSGVVERLEAMNDGPVSEYTQITVRMIWGIILLIASLFVLYGSVKMKHLTNYRLARAAAVVAMIPLVGPCCLLGIPFGIWALMVLLKPHVRDAFV